MELITARSGCLKLINIPKTNREFLDEAEIIGIMLGDGHIMQNNCSIRLRVRELDFCQHFKNLIQRTYCTEAPLDDKYYYNCYAHSKLLTQRIIQLTNHNTEIPGFVLNGNNEIKARFLRGFFDSEGSVDVIYNRRQIVLTQNNAKMLLQIKGLLRDMGIQSKYVFKKVGSDKLIISLLRNLERYQKLVGFAINYKQLKLSKAIDYLQKCKAHETDKYWTVLTHWIQNNKSLRSSAKEMSMHWETYRSWVYGMKMPCQIKQDIKFKMIPEDYQYLKSKYCFLP